MWRFLRYSLWVVFLFFLGVGSLGYWGYQQFVNSGPLAHDKAVIIEKGSVQSVAQKLYRVGVLRYPQVFSLAVRLTGEGRNLKAGEYLIKAHASPQQVLDKIASYDIIQYSLTIPEGWTSRQIIDRLNGIDALSGTISYRPQEGTLLPQTYQYTRGDKKETILQRMDAKLKEEVADLWQKRDRTIPFKNWKQAIILASVVEKETGIGEERAKIAGVFYNRLKIGMKLQSDPTVIYALTKGDKPLGRALTHEDLAIDSPYNTYRYAGLPQSPICQPGRQAIEAVLHPAQTEALYFVANGTGGHVFAKTLEEHNANVRKWLKKRGEKATSVPKQNIILKAKDKHSPTKSKDASLLNKTKDKPSPTKPKDESLLNKAKDKHSPTKSKDASLLNKTKNKPSPTKSKDDSSSNKAKDKPSPTKSKDESLLNKAKDKPSPTKSKDESLLNKTKAK